MVARKGFYEDGHFDSKVNGEYVTYEDYAKLESHLNGILDMLAKLDNDLGYGLIPDEYAYDRVGEILEMYRNVTGN
ncbi:TPA_asm: hypothetical protein G2716_22855 [Salmonella enterica subsp. enterica serovar Enteritidis]|uniref:Uncharacterized protein n=2 Tax=Salmonella enteritidis TaxID=149539 RepID=A0A725JX50_SALEP|nr:hypothetical protein [Salmonella enterica subsp. enterica serovar Enteritidis]HAE0259446.1 hypothetical protein [Salmonella enterica subsp. enterica serovar Enteritidis str. P125109]HAG7046292.1 hypothetical protein [Salmonella enterica subsp. enterica serovar Typhimurium]HCR8479169.1 hypothetical protein [Shigella flexneri]HAE0166159.1 hypothetical protein [Salmonella enterica subsp. enterica serovar Enteritidis]